MNEQIRTLCLPSRVEWGPGSLQLVPEVLAALGAEHAFVVSDPGIVAAGHLERLLTTLRPSVHLSLFTAVEPEPTVAVIDAAAEALLTADDVDVIVSLGGGSVIDTAKGAGVIALNGGRLDEYADGAEDAREITRVLPHVALPTTAGTGSEATAWSVFVDPAARVKDAVYDRRLVPAAAILDPELTLSVPAAVTAGTGMDALTHAVEAFVSTSSSPATDALALKAAELVAGHLRRAVRDGSDLEARSALLLGSFLAGAAFSNSSCGLVHTLSEALGGFYRVPHGVTNGLLLAPVMAFNVPACPAAFARLAAVLTSADAAARRGGEPGDAVAAVRDLAADIGLPGSLDELGVPRADVPALAAAAFEWANDSGNPRRVTLEEIRVLLYEALGPERGTP